MTAHSEQLMTDPATLKRAGEQVRREQPHGPGHIHAGISLTVVVPVRNEERFIADTMAQLLAQDFAKDEVEILVADAMSDDATRQIVREISIEHPHVKLLDNPKGLSSAGRNVGFRNGRGVYFLVVDGHCYLPDKRLFANVVRLFEETAADCLGRPQPLDPPGINEFQLAVARVRSTAIGHGPSSEIYGDREGTADVTSNGAAYRRSVFEQIGYVDESFDACEDVEFNYRAMKAGLRGYTSPSLTVQYYPRENYKRLFKQMIRYGYGRCLLFRKYTETLGPLTLAPAALVLLLALTMFYLPWSRGSIYFPYLAGLLGCYAIMVAGAAALLCRKDGGWKWFARYIALFLTIHVGLGYGFLRSWIQYLAAVLSGRKQQRCNR